jgi:glycosyltransferase involved in cell wall biosynthesis
MKLQGFMQDNRIKVLKFLTNFNIGGTERQFVQMVQQMDLDRFDLRLGCFARRGGFLPLVESRGIPLTEFTIRRLYSPFTLWRQLQFAHYLRWNRFQVVHTYGFYPNFFAVPAARLAGVPVIIASIRDTGEVWEPKKRLLQKAVCKLATCVLANADAVRSQLIRDGYNERKLAVIRNGVDLPRLDRREASGPIRQEFGIPQDSPIITVLSRINELKGIQYFLDALPAVLTRVPNARFLIVGDGPARVGLESYAQSKSFGRSVIFTGARLDVPKILQETSISVLPSLSEGLSNVLIESMAAGVPVVATNVGGNPEIVDEGTTGLLVPPRDANALAAAMLKLLSDPESAARMGSAGRDRIERRFSMGRAVHETQQLYTTLLQSSGRLIPEVGAT